MATIDIRDNFPIVDTIRFWDNQTGNYLATGLTYNVDMSISGNSVIVNINDLENIRSLQVTSEEHAKYLIKALNKAIEIGWFKE